MKKEPIIFEWYDKGENKKKIKEVDRKEFFDIMYSIKKGFPNDNQVSTVLCDIIPDVSTIFIDKDRNQQIDVPFIYYDLNGNQKVLEIIRYHKIIWSILNKYTE